MKTITPPNRQWEVVTIEEMDGSHSAIPVQVFTHTKSLKAGYELEKFYRRTDRNCPKGRAIFARES